ncbi:MAG: dnaG [Candidatus Saccharibacteria bacterium]|nr:dnaG [Candidatus Saccharibacteria bacterium]
MDAVEEIKSRLNIEDVIGEYVELKRAGRNFKGLSPFSNERSPSFMVSPDKQIWHDFSSGKGGNMFSFVMEVEGLDFKGALELLARKAGVDLDQFRQGPGQNNGKQKERLYEALELAAKFYQTQFANNRGALEYVLQKRRFSKETALAWQLGYSPNQGRALVDFMRSKKFTEQEIKQAGLLNQYKSDMFRGRIMIPLADPQGRVIGFTARLLEDNPDAPKYINTPQTPLYDKSRHVYGLHMAKESIRRNNYVVISEGNLDVIASHQAGVKQVVATAGTALTEQHLKALSRFTHDVRLCFDADKAGLNATERAIPIASKVGVTLSIVSIPSGKDPDELIKQDPKIWEDIITKPQPALDWLMDRYKSQLDITTAPGKRQFSDVLLPTVQALTDSVEKDHYINRISEIIQISREALFTKLDKTPAAGKATLKKTAKPTELDPLLLNAKRAIGLLLSIMLVQPTMRDTLERMPEYIFEDNASLIRTFLLENRDFNIKQATALPAELREYGNELLLQYETEYQNLDGVELEYNAKLLRQAIIDNYAKYQTRRLGEAMGTLSEEEQRTLLAKVAALNKLRR